MRLLTIALLMIVGCNWTTQSPASKIEPPSPLPLPESIVELFSKFRDCEQMELVSLDPNPKSEGPKLYGWTVRGSTSIADASVRMRLVDEMAGAALASGTIVKDCFEPRHALRLHASGHDYDVIICFACSAVSVYTDGDSSKFEGFCITNEPSEYFNRILAEARVGR